LDWSISRATQLTNIVFSMPNFSTGHTGIFMPEGGSGTMMGDLTFNESAIGLNMNNQQYEGITASSLLSESYVGVTDQQLRLHPS